MEIRTYLKDSLDLFRTKFYKLQIQGEIFQCYIITSLLFVYKSINHLLKIFYLFILQKYSEISIGALLILYSVALKYNDFQSVFNKEAALIKVYRTYSYNSFFVNIAVEILIHWFFRLCSNTKFSKAIQFTYPHLT